MTVIIVGLLVCLALSILVMAVVAVPARRQGRDILTSRGERVVVKVREGADSAATRATGVVPRTAAPDEREVS